MFYFNVIDNSFRRSYASCSCTQSTQCWPQEWLPQDCQNIRVIGINYDTNISMWASMCPEEHLKSNLDERSNEFLLKLHKAGVGKRPIVWVTHSMGGLLVKNMLVQGNEIRGFQKVQDLTYLF